MSDTGWFKVARHIFSHPIADDRPWCKGFMWLYLVSMAAHDEYVVPMRNQDFLLKRGQLSVSTNELATKAGWSRNRVVRFLAYLHRNGMIQTHTEFCGTLIKIVNYDKWQLQATAQATEQATAQAEAALSQTIVTIPEQATAQATEQANKEKSPHTPLKKEDRRMSLQEKDTPPTPSKQKLPLLTFDKTTLKVVGVTPSVRSFFCKAFPSADLDYCMEKMRVWIIKNGDPHKTYWKSLCTFASDERDNHAKNRMLLTTGAMAGQSVKIESGVGQVQENKRPTPPCDTSKMIKGA